MKLKFISKNIKQNCQNGKLCVDRNGFFAQKLEPITRFTNAIDLFICEFKIRGLLPERIYRELRGPPVPHLNQLFGLKV